MLHFGPNLLLVKINNARRNHIFCGAIKGTDHFSSNFTNGLHAYMLCFFCRIISKMLSAILCSSESFGYFLLFYENCTTRYKKRKICNYVSTVCRRHYLKLLITWPVKSHKLKSLSTYNFVCSFHVSFCFLLLSCMAAFCCSLK